MKSVNDNQQKNEKSELPEEINPEYNRYAIGIKLKEFSVSTCD